MDNLLEAFEKALLSLDQIKAGNLLKEASDPIQFIENVVTPSLEKVGDAWEKGSVALAQVYMSSRICEKLVETVLPPSSEHRINQPPMAIALLEDHHSLGKILIYSSLRANGFELQDFGRLEVDDLVQKAIDEKIRILLISVLMLPSALHIKKVTAQLKQKNIDIKVIVGGAPFRFDDNLWKEVDADATGNNTADALWQVQRIIKEIS